MDRRRQCVRRDISIHSTEPILYELVNRRVDNTPIRLTIGMHVLVVNILTCLV